MHSSHSQHQPPTDFIDFYHIWQTLNEYKAYLFGFATLVAVVTLYVISQLTPTYVATATLLLEDRKTSPLALGSPFDMGLQGDDLVATEIEILRSRNLMLQVIDTLDMGNHPAFKNALQEQSLGQMINKWLPFLQPESPAKNNSAALQAKMLGKFDSLLSTRNIAQTRLISVSFESGSPELARDVTNTLTQLYIQRHQQNHQENSRLEAQWLEDRLEELQIQLQKSEKTLTDFIENNDLIVINGVSGLSANKIKQLEQQLLKEQQRLLELSGIEKLVARAGLDNLSPLLSIDYIANNPTVRGLRQSQLEVMQKINELSAIYGNKHPKMISAHSELAQTEAKLKQEIQALAANAATNMKASQEILTQLRQELQRVRKEHQRNQEMENQYIRLQREVDTSRQMYEKLLQQSLHNAVTTVSNVGFARIVDEAIAPLYPAKPKKKLIVIVTMTLATALAITFILLFDAMNDTFRSSEDIHKYLTAPLLGITPRIDKNKKQPFDFAFFDKRQLGFIEAIRTIKTNLLLQLRQNPQQQLISITSTQADEGKSVVAMNLAFALSGQGKVLLIDADFRHPCLGRRFGLPADHPGLTDLLRGDCRFAQCIHDDRNRGITVLPAGTPSDDPLELLSSPRFQRLMQGIRQHFKYVIIDTVQAEAVADTFVVAKQSDLLLYVVKANSTRRNKAAGLFKRFAYQGSPVNGIIVTQVDVTQPSNHEHFAGYYDFGRYAEPMPVAGKQHNLLKLPPA